jgi:hypothetical protein
MRRSSSACGPPPSWPRDHSQIWSDSRRATRPLADVVEQQQGARGAAVGGASIRTLPLHVGGDGDAAVPAAPAWLAGVRAPAPAEARGDGVTVAERGDAGAEGVV